MSNNKFISNCHVCSVVSQANGEDPIGSAGTPEYYLIIEAAPPWLGTIWLEVNPMPQLVLDALSFVWESGVKIRQLAIAPDREYSQPGYTRIFYCCKPAGLFAQFEKQEFIVPHDLVGALATALLKQPDELSFFEQYRQPTSHIRELLVCTHGNHDVACGRFGYPIYRQLRSKYCADGLRVWRCSHFGGHQFAPTLIDWEHPTF